MHRTLLEVRTRINTLASMTMCPSLVYAIRLAINELRIVRESWFSKELVKTPSSVCKYSTPKQEINKVPGEDLIVEEISQISRAALTSTTYNSELTFPYRILWAKVIMRAAYDYALWKDSKDIRLRRFADDAAKWLFELQDEDYELSFENICFAFNFPVTKIREKTRVLTREDVKKLEFRERQGKSKELSDGNY